jgi:hypothetical protein
MEHISFWPVLEANNKVGLEINAEKVTWVFKSRHQSAGQNHNTDSW